MNAAAPQFHPVFWELHRGLPRQGPGGDRWTRRAFRALAGLPARPRIVDVGCGPGMQTLELARLSGTGITAVDRHAPFLEELLRSAEQAGLADRMQAVCASMFDLPLANDSVDLLWAEGAIYIMGFAAGLRTWRPLLRTHGCVVVSEATWLRPDPPEPVARFWAAGYPAMTSAAGNVRIAESCGYRCLEHFVLPAEAWWTHYYRLLEARLPALRRRHAGDPAAQEALDEEAAEIRMHREFGEFYGYVFYVLRREDR